MGRIFLIAAAAVLLIGTTAAGADLGVLDDIADKRIGVLGGTVFDGFITQHYPGAEVLHYDRTPDMILSLRTGKLDAVMMDLSTARLLVRSGPNLRILSDDVFDMPLGIGFRKDDPGLRDEFNAFLTSIRQNGLYDELERRWFVADAEQAVMPVFDEPDSGRVLKVGVSVADLPYVAYMNNQYVGFDIEIIKRFAGRAGYRTVFSTMDFAALVPALAAGKVDMISDGMAITAERAGMIDFSDPYAVFRTAVVIAVNDEGAPATPASPAGPSFLKGVAESFYNNIIKEDRYVLILEGLKTTAVISVLATLVGTLLGGLVCLMRMSHKGILRIPARIYISILRGTPVLVVLMIIFYVVFAAVDIDPVFVAVIAFGLNFAAYVSEMYRTGIESVDRGQTEAGIAMGFTRVQTFTHIVLPQAVRRILPVYKGEMISLVKMTSVVGYIAVQDLTKASDIIRSRTFDAFFPLIMVAVLYFLISWLLMHSLGYVERRINPHFRPERIQPA